MAGSGGGTSVDGHDDHRAGRGTGDDGGVRVEDVVTGVVLRPVGRLAEGQLVLGPRVLRARGDHEHVAGARPESREQVHRLFGGVERPSAEAGISWICGLAAVAAGVAGPEGPGLAGSHVTVAHAAPAARAAEGRDDRGGIEPRGGGRVRGGGRRGTAAGRSGAGTLGTLVNLRLLGNEGMS